MAIKNSNGNGTYVTVKQLYAELRSLRWEMRFIILAAIIGGDAINVIPTSIAFISRVFT